MQIASRLSELGGSFSLPIADCQLPIWMWSFQPSEIGNRQLAIGNVKTR